MPISFDVDSPGFEPGHLQEIVYQMAEALGFLGDALDEFLLS
jgi:hypothetical protein